MMFTKPLTDIDEKDIQALADNGEQESATLEFKQKLDSTGEEKSIKDVKKELVKDVSAMANANGGFIIYGIKEEKGGKAKEVVGIEREIKGRPVEEWVGQVLISSVRPRLSFIPRVVNLEEDGKIVLVLQVSRIPYRPHMVLAENVYYVRNNSGVALADEHEVRAMVLESKSSSDEMKEFLKKRNLDDKDKKDFALNPLTKGMRETPSMLDEKPAGYEGKPFVLFASCPRHLEERVHDIASEDFERKAIQSGKFNLLSLHIDFLRGLKKHTTSESVRFTNPIFKNRQEILDNPAGYVEIFRNGYVERGLCESIIANDPGRTRLGLLFHISFFAADFWAYMKFIRQLYEQIGYFDEINISIALSNTKKVTAYAFRHGGSWGGVYSTAQEENVLIEKSAVLSELQDTKIEEIVKEVVGRVTNHFDQTIGDCLDEEGKFDEDLLKHYYARQLHRSLYIS